MPKLWNDTIEAHRRDVHDAILNTAAALVAEHGVRSVTMSQIAEETGIGRATLYKYFPDVESILIARHERQVSRHLKHLAEIRDQARDPGERLKVVLEAFALMSHEHHDAELAALVHRGEHFERAQRQLGNLVQALVIEAAAAGVIRSDVAPNELTSYCLHTVAAARDLASEAAVFRLVMLTLDGLRYREPTRPKVARPATASAKPTRGHRHR